MWGAGFFPPDDEALFAFAARMIADSRSLDVLATWQPGEGRLKRRFFPDAALCDMGGLSCPFREERPWTRTLQGKRVLVVHPFADSIKRQFSRRTALFPAGRGLPAFNLETIKPPVTNAGNWKTSTWKTWFEALDRTVQDVSRIDFDVLLVGAGAYGFPLAAAAKRMGKIGIQLGGATQLLFGIKGRRWDGTDIGRTFYNEHWVRPAPEETPAGANTIEGGCYW